MFISFRFSEAEAQAKCLYDKLKALGVSAFMCASENVQSTNLSSVISTNIVNAKVAVILGTETYGKNTGNGFSTYQEMVYIHGDKYWKDERSLFLIKMCKEFIEAETQFRLAKNIRSKSGCEPNKCQIISPLSSEIG